MDWTSKCSLFDLVLLLQWSSVGTLVKHYIRSIVGFDVIFVVLISLFVINCEYSMNKSEARFNFVNKMFMSRLGHQIQVVRDSWFVN